METAGKTLDEKELSDAMKETGLGTPATRAAIIEVLLKRGYIVRNGKSLEATDKGIRLIEVVHPEVKSPAMTGQWEAYLKRIQRGAAQLEPFLKGIEDYVREVVGKVGKTPLATKAAMAPGPEIRKGSLSGRNRPRQCRSERATRLPSLLHSAFGFSSFRPNQEAVCRAAVEGKDVLLVMPTGSGKSLCYQLPGIARGGTTLVISPLIALDGRSGRQAQGAGLRRRPHPFRPRPRRLAPGLPRLPQRQAAVPVHRAGTAARGRFPGDAGETKAVPDRHRRGALHLAVGARFPAGLPHARPVPALVAPGARNCADRYGHAARSERHRRAVGAGAAGALHSRVSARQHRD